MAAASSTAGILIPMSGLVLVGGALVLGGLGTIGFGTAMSQRTDAGAYVDAMLTAYRRTLRKTMEQARDIGEVVKDPEVATLADTPDKAVVWGIALGLRDEVSRCWPADSRSSARQRGRPPAPITRSGSGRHRRATAGRRHRWARAADQRGVGIGLQ